MQVQTKQSARKCANIEANAKRRKAPESTSIFDARASKRPMHRRPEGGGPPPGGNPQKEEGWAVVPKNASGLGPDTDRAGFVDRNFAIRFIKFWGFGCRCLVVF